jgi:hypothetical protein
MNKILITIFGIITLLVIGVICMFSFSICPPEGPWPMPPWCYSSSLLLPFKFEKPNYVNFLNGNAKKIILGVGTMDIWGNPHLLINLGENTENNYQTALKRIGSIGSKSYLFTDFINLGEGTNIKVLDKKTFPATYNISEEDLKNVVKIAKENYQERVIMLTNLSDTKNEIEGFISSANKDKNIKEMVMGQLFKKFTENSAGLTSEESLRGFNETQWQEFLNNLKTTMVSQAKKAQVAGVTDFIINPADVIIDYRYPGSLSNYWTDLAKEVKNVFTGRIGFFGYPDIISKTNLSDFDFTVVYFEVNGDKMAKSFFQNSEVNVDSLKIAFQKYFQQSFWSEIKNEKILLVTIPSYKGVISGGWIEPGELHSDLIRDDKEQALLYESLFETAGNNVESIISYGYWWSPNMYPASKPLRNDLSHSIRNKDAEQVFYYWATN